MTGVIEVPGGDSIDGGRPYQAGMQVGAATLIDPATNLSRMPLPAGARFGNGAAESRHEVEFRPLLLRPRAGADAPRRPDGPST